MQPQSDLGSSVRLGLLGGTFDPVHSGHISLALHALEQLYLDQVWLIPSSLPPHKLDRRVAPPDIRFEMVAAATAPYKPRLVASEIELTRVGTSFTFETVAQVRESVGPSVELFWIIGRDNIAEIPRWKSPRRIVQAATIVAGGRPGTTVPERIPLWLAGKLIILDGPNLAVSSTELRDQAAQGILDPEWIPESVRAIIMREGLYGYPHTTLPKN